MRDDRRSRTAESAAASRAIHMVRDGGVLFADPYAAELTSPGLRRVVRSPLLRWGLRRLLGDMALMGAGHVIARARWAEEGLEAAVRAGIGQYVLIGAGLDSFALRRPDLMAALEVFEIDHPATQRTKRERLAALGLELPKGLHFVPVDFEKESLEEGLARSAFAPGRPSYHSWLGTIPYLSEEAIFGTLRCVAALCAAGSELALSFDEPVDGLTGSERRSIRRLLRYTARRGEPLISFFEPDDFVKRVAALGFEAVERVPVSEQERRFLADRRHGLRSIPGAWFARFRRL
jgi:methyltransferase (TIGR00027 family)